MVIAIVISFTIALIIHGHQTEATYRLDFLWKLQATGDGGDTHVAEVQPSIDMSTFRGEGGDGAPAGLQQEAALQHSPCPRGRVLHVGRQEQRCEEQEN